MGVEALVRQPRRGGVGQRVRHNLMHDGPHNAIQLGGNDHLIEFNDVHSAVRESDDQGAMELWRNATYRGVVFRYNRFRSVGKTGTKEALRLCLAPQGATSASIGSFNNHWGVPLTLARLPQTAEYAIVEIGMNAPGEIAPLSRLARPHVAIVTSVAAAHLEAFDDIDEDVLRPIVAQLIREELQGELGERITRNVRKLVRREIKRALAARDLI